jgi:pimeloyl-ACP methyl ester carboxylesterase
VRTLRWIALVVLALVLLVVAGERSGDQPPRDALAAAERELGIDLDERRVDVGEVELHVVLAGPEGGPPVVLLHGFPEFWYAWFRQMGALAAAGFRVIAPDQRGYGGSSKPREVESYRVDHLADDVAGLVAALGYETAFVAAHDWGGGVAWQLALRHPDRVRKLAVFGTPHPRAGRDAESEEETVSWYRTFFQIPWLPEWAARLANWRVMARSLRDGAAPGAFPDEKLDLYRSAWDQDGAFSTMVNWYRAGFRHPEAFEDGRVGVPTLVVVARDDAFIPSDLSRASLDYLDQGRLVELGTGTHWVLQEEPELTSRILIGFFAE